jgi:hypothetical protein
MTGGACVHSSSKDGGLCPATQMSAPPPAAGVIPQTYGVHCALLPLPPLRIFPLPPARIFPPYTRRLPDTFLPPASFPVCRQHLYCPLLIRHICRGHDNRLRQSLRVNRDMPFYPGHFFPASYPFACAVSAFWTLCASMMPNQVQYRAKNII